MGRRYTAVILGLLCLAQTHRPDGGIGGSPNQDPVTLTRESVDVEMWPIVEAINRSGWIWTTESCQGHEGRYPLTLGVVTDDMGRFFQALSEAHAMVAPANYEDRRDPGGLELQVTWWLNPAVNRGKFQVRIVSRDIEQRDAVLQLFRETARRILSR